MHESQLSKTGQRRPNPRSRSYDERRTLFFDPSGSNTDLVPAIEKSNWRVDLATSMEAAEKCLYNSEYKVAVITLKHTDLERIEQIENLLNRHPLHWVAVVGADVIEDDIVAGLVSDHCYDYYTLPCDTRQLIGTLGHAFGMSLLRPASALPDPTADADTHMVGNSESMRNLHATIKKSARVEAPVMITGETGTGKELVGRALHNQSPRSNNPFVTVSCATVPAGSISEELFGAERDGVTTKGKIELAHTGSLFLDSVTDLPAEQQMLLLRFLQNGAVERINGTQMLPVDVRIITSSNSSIDEAVKNGQFREDLYYRLNILHIEIPALRDRLGDVDTLAQYFFNKFSNETPGRIKGFSQQAKIAMHQHHWSGNVRELLNRVRQAMVMCEGSLIQPVDLGLSAGTGQESDHNIPTNLDEVRAKAEGEFIRNALERNYNNVTETAAQLGVSRVTLYRLMKKYGVTIAGGGRRKSTTS
jgi:DNA-binding NtrC family response regulator